MKLYKLLGLKKCEGCEKITDFGKQIIVFHSDGKEYKEFYCSKCSPFFDIVLGTFGKFVRDNSVAYYFFRGAETRDSWIKVEDEKLQDWFNKIFN